MNSKSKRLSNISLSDIQSFEPNQSQKQLPFLCYFCGTNTLQSTKQPNTIKKQKINLSKINRNSKQSTMRKSINSDIQFMRRSHNNIQTSSFLKHPEELKSTQPTLLKTQQRSSQSFLCSQIVKNKNIQPSHNIRKSQIIYTPVVTPQVRYSIGYYPENNVVYEDQLHPMIQTVKNIPPTSSHFIKPVMQMRSTDTINPRKSMTFYYTNPINTQITQQNSISSKSNTENLKIQRKQSQSKISLIPMKQLEDLHISKKKQIIQCRQVKQIKPFFSPSNVSTQQQIPPPPFTRFREVESINEPSEFKLQKKSSKQYSPSKVPNFIKNMKKASSRSQTGQLKKSTDSQISHTSYVQLGNKIKIGVRKAQSINSQIEDQDQYSQVLSHGQRSFLMPGIDQVEQMSRVSSISGFKNWQEEQQKNI